MGDLPEDQALSKREELQRAMERERLDRAKATMEAIVKLLKASNCEIGTRPSLVETAPGKFSVSSEWGVQAL